MEVKPGYKRTEIGVIPENWDVRRGLEITHLIGKGASPRWQGFDYANDGMLFVTSENVRDGYLDISNPKFLPLAFHEKLRRTQLGQDDILVNLVGASIGRSCRITQEIGTANVNQAVAVFRLRDVRSAPFVEYFFQAPTTIKRILDMQADAARPNISFGNLRQFSIPLPPLREQQSIAKALGDVDELLGVLTRLNAKKRDLKHAAMQQLLTGQIRLPGFSGEWEVKRLGEVSSVNSDSLSADTPSHYEFNYISLEDVDTGVLRTHSEQVLVSAPSRARRRLKHGDILVSTVRPNLRSHLLFTRDEPHWICSTGFSVVRCISGVALPAYVFFHMFGNAVSKQIDTLLTGSNYPAINGGDVKALQIPMPSIEEQIAIAAVLSDMDAELAALEARLAKTQALKQGMMQELLTGRTRLV